MFGFTVQQLLTAFVASGGLAAFIKMNAKKPIFKTLASLFTTTDSPTDTKVELPSTIPPAIAAILGPFLQRLVQNPAAPIDPTKPVVVPANADTDTLAKILTDLVNSPNTVDEKLVHIPNPDASLAHVVACAEAMSKEYPDCDILIAVIEGKVSVERTERK